MTRRALLLAMWTAVRGAAAGQPSLKNDVANSANDFTAAYAIWAKCFNRIPQGGIDASEMAGFEPLGKLWRQVEHLRTRWIRGR
jgi:hypothetical protein